METQTRGIWAIVQILIPPEEFIIIQLSDAEWRLCLVAAP